ncbi:hypothetical protein GE09DRAFT_230722 [Coniochaeta sp. 2T2.1]|nr:hypothetical protein GE09DRAFT_230722 [Coniochaeta sp. 2T2.1]
MGGLCSIYRQGSGHAEMDAHEFQHSPTKLVNNPQDQDASPQISDTVPSNAVQSSNSYDQARDLVEISMSQRNMKRDPLGTVLDRANRARSFRDEDDYYRQRAEIKAREDARSWDFICKRDASPIEQKADETLQALRMHDEQKVYAEAEVREGYSGQKHPRFMGDRFLSNVKLIQETKVFEVAERMPKGAHLHIHFNANLLPQVLLNIAADMDRMFIWSDVSLAPVGKNEADSRYYYNLGRSKIEFSILSIEEEAKRMGLHKTCNIFDPYYPVGQRLPMRFKHFLEEFGEYYKKLEARKWLIDKLVFHEDEAHGLLQTPEGAWDRFNARTKMMKGLFNYATAYRKYTRECLEEFVRDNIQYAEIRPNFMTTNQLFDDEGKLLGLDPKEEAGSKGSNKGSNMGSSKGGDVLRGGNVAIMDIIVQACDAFMKNRKDAFAGIKVIYCVPRSTEPEKLVPSLNECLNFKTHSKYGKWIAGFDLVGEESKGRPLKDFIPQLLAFKEKCRANKVDIPFLFHCGETLDVGNDTDGNLYDALLLGAKRIGHGFALPRHPYIMEEMKKDNICLELCPISNEILGLTPRVSGHAMYSLLANNVHCSVNTDNGTLFQFVHRSTLSHDFYQVFAGKADMTLYGWKQLALWSIEHSCLEDDKRKELLLKWNNLWVDFCHWIVREFGKFIQWAELQKRAQSRAGI